MFSFTRIWTWAKQIVPAQLAGYSRGLSDEQLPKPHVTEIQPSRKYIWLTWIERCLLFIAVLFFFLVSLSSPIIKSIYILQASPSHQPSTPSYGATQVRFGVWGHCATNDFNVQVCSSLALGFQVPESSLDDLKNIIDVDLLLVLRVLLTLVPICAVCSLLALILTFCWHRKYALITSFCLAVLTSVLGTLSVFVGLLAVKLIQHYNPIGGVRYLSVKAGSAVYLVFVAVVFSWIVVILFSFTMCGCCGNTRSRHYRRIHSITSYSKGGQDETGKDTSCSDIEDGGTDASPPLSTADDSAKREELQARTTS